MKAAVGERERKSSEVQEGVRHLEARSTNEARVFVEPQEDAPIKVASFL